MKSPQKGERDRAADPRRFGGEPPAEPDALDPRRGVPGEGGSAAEGAGDDAASDLAVRAHVIFSAALDEPAEHRATLLDRLCADDASLRAWVEALLEAETTVHPLLDTDLSFLAAALLDDPDPAGRRFGAYRILREIGRGGMGVVYQAERADGAFDRRVALKVIRAGPDADALAARFHQERQILASLQHPNIAQLLDGGQSPDGHPFLAMEYVEGEPIDRYCDARGLGIEARLRLFATVCAAVDHAHRSLVVHRDLKPAHILVTEDGVVKLLDFGIAKLLSDDGPAVDETQTALHMFTPRYSSPEQIRQGPITTGTDVYALGVVLFELLTGRTPFADAGDRFEAARATLESEPPPPSTLAPPEWRARVRGDLDAIVLRALKKDPAERYPTAGAVADDLARWLRYEPVQARPDSAGYRLRKFVRRHRAAVAGTTALVMVAAASLAVHGARITQERNRAELEARKAGEVRDFLLSMFTSNLPGETLGDTLRLSDVLDRGVQRTDSIVDQPELRALLLNTVGDVYRVLGRYDRAGPLLEQALALYRELDAPPPLDLANALASMSMLHWDLREYEESLPYIRESLAIQRRELGEGHPDVITSMNNLATTSANIGRLDKALELHHEVLRHRRRMFGADDPVVTYSLNNIGALLFRQERYDEAERYFAESLEIRRKRLPASHPDLALSLNNLAAVYRELGRLDEAEPLYRESLEARRKVLGDEHPRVAVAHFNLGRLLHLKGELAAAEPHMRTALEIDRRVYGPDHPEVGVDAYQLAALLMDRDACEAALPVLVEAKTAFGAGGPARAARLAQVRIARGECLVRMGREEDAAAEFRAAVLAAELADPPDPAVLSDARARLDALRAAGK